MRWRAAAGALGAAVLAGAVIVLREQVPPPTLHAQPDTTPRPVAAADPGLPAQDPARAPRWRIFTPQRGAIDGVAGPQHLVYTRAAGDRLELTLQHRDTGEQLAQHAVPYDEAPWSSLLHDGLLLVAHGRQQVRLLAIDPATGQTSELAPPDGYSFRPRLVELGDEVLLLGWQTEPDGGESQRSCVLAVRPRAATARVAWCAEHGRVPAWLYSGVDEVLWPAAAALPTGCLQWQRLQPGGEVETLPPNSALCGARGLIEFDGWQIAQRVERDVAEPLIVADDGSRQVALGTAAAFVGCGRHVYWSAATHGVDPDTVYRWRPGADHREVAYRLESSSRLALAVPRCTDGVLSVAVTAVARNGLRLVELRALNRP